jgi:hypothetical protein
MSWWDAVPIHASFIEGSESERRIEFAILAGFTALAVVDSLRVTDSLLFGGMRKTVADSRALFALDSLISIAT